MESAFWASVFAVLYPYSVYPVILLVARRIGHGESEAAPTAGDHAASSPFTMIVAAHNEEAGIGRKVAETVPLLAADPASELIVVSDHSSDGTVDAARALGHPQVRVIENQGSRGRAGAHNFAIGLARNECVLFSDVDTRVPEDTVRRMVRALGTPRTGCVNAEIAFAEESGDQVARSAGLYWRFEVALRALETRLGLLATSSGPCMAVRRSLYREIPPTGDVDFTSPLDVVEQGYRCAHLPGALAFDVMPANAAAEFKARVRMVAKNFSGTVSRWGWRNLLRRPLYTWALYSHKVWRWLTPYFMLAALALNVPLALRHWGYGALLGLQVAFYGAALLGWAAYRGNRAWPVISQIFAFALANTAFAIGVLKALAGRAPSFYLPTRQLDK